MKTSKNVLGTLKGTADILKMIHVQTMEDSILSNVAGGIQIGTMI